MFSKQLQIDQAWRVVNGLKDSFMLIIQLRGSVIRSNEMTVDMHMSIACDSTGNARGSLGH